MEKYELPDPDEETAALLQSMSASMALTPALPAYVTFSTKSKQNKEKSKEAGRPIFESVEYVEILCPGDKDTIVDRPVRNLDRYTWSEKYIAFRNKRSQDSGTPLTVWGGITEERAKELEHFRIKTVEQLAGVPDGNLGNLGLGARAEREKARGYLAVMKDAAPIAEMKAENEALKARLDALEKLAAMGAPQGPGPTFDPVTGLPSEKQQSKVKPKT